MRKILLGIATMACMMTANQAVAQKMGGVILESHVRTLSK